MPLDGISRPARTIRTTEVELVGHVVGRIWQGMVCSMHIAQPMPHGGGTLRQHVERMLRRQGDFQPGTVKLGRTCRVVITVRTQGIDRERVHKRTWSIARFKSVRDLVDPRRVGE